MRAALNLCTRATRRQTGRGARAQPPHARPPPSPPLPRPPLTAAGALFLILYGITAVYFSGVMVRLMLVLAPAACCLAGVAVSDILTTLCCSLKAHGAVLPLPGLARSASGRIAGGSGDFGAAAKGAGAARRGGKDGGDGGGVLAREWNPLPKAVAVAGFAGIVVLMVSYTIHCIG
jgi:dolichyl-diphosphooligosaccharide--protein glycosyltransferase